VSDDREPRAYLSFVRVTRARGTSWLLSVGATFTSIGGFMIGAAFVKRLDDHFRTLASLGGAAILIFGLVTAFSGLAALLMHDVYIAIREDGVILHANKDETFLPWSTIARVRLGEDARSVHFDTKDDADGPAGGWIVGGEAGELVDRLEQLRRKAALGPLLALA
jgi:hypothetical protein